MTVHVGTSGPNCLPIVPDLTGWDPAQDVPTAWARLKEEAVELAQALAKTARAAVRRFRAAWRLLRQAARHAHYVQHGTHPRRVRDDGLTARQYRAHRRALARARRIERRQHR